MMISSLPPSPRFTTTLSSAFNGTRTSVSAALSDVLVALLFAAFHASALRYVKKRRSSYASSS